MLVEQALNLGDDAPLVAAVAEVEGAAAQGLGHGVTSGDHMSETG